MISPQEKAGVVTWRFPLTVTAPPDLILSPGCAVSEVNEIKETKITRQSVFIRSGFNLMILMVK